MCPHETNSIRYLGVCVSNDSKDNACVRINAALRAFFVLKRTGVFTKVIDTKAMSYIFNTAIRPVFLYRLQNVDINSMSFVQLEELQGKLVK